MLNPLRPPDLPSWLTFQLLERCNLRCSMCYEWGDAGTYHGREPVALDVDLVLGALRECRPARPFVELFGGEPLLYPAIWDVIAAARAGGSEVAFPTNGTLLARHAERLVAAQPTQLWVSLDGPPAVNDAQRGPAVFARAEAGLRAVAAEKRRRATPYPHLGVTCVVTPATAATVEELFVKALDLTELSMVSIEVQSWLPAERLAAWEELAGERFGVPDTPGARGYLADAGRFAGIDRQALADQIDAVRRACRAAGVAFTSQPRLTDPANLDHYLNGRADLLAGARRRCAVPWAALEVSARGEVTACHSFYDVSLGNLHEQSLEEIWRGERLTSLRALLRERLLPICVACCRYHAPAPVVLSASDRSGTEGRP